MTMTKPTIEAIYEELIKDRSRGEKRVLLGLLIRDLRQKIQPGPDGKYNILDFEGVGADLWQGIDAQEYVNKMRDEWDRPR